MGRLLVRTRRNLKPLFAARYSLLLLLLAFSFGCTVRLISDYDEVIDHSATELQKKLETFLRTMEGDAGKSAGEYESNKKTYDEFKTDLSAIRVRANASLKNDLTLKHIDNIDATIDTLRELHKHDGKDGLPPNVAEPALSALNIEFTAVIKLELAKKRGQSASPTK